MDLDEIKSKKKTLTEIEYRISIGFRLKEDMDWLVTNLKEHLTEEEYDKQSRHRSISRSGQA